MADRKAAQKGKQKSAQRAVSSSKASGGFTAEEQAAVREAVRERRAGADEVWGESVVLAKIAEMPAADRALAERVHAIIRASAPGLTPRTWYGMPAYSKDGNVVCFFKNASKFKTRYATLGFSDEAKLDEGDMWPTEFALKELTLTEEARISALVKKAVG